MARSPREKGQPLITPSQRQELILKWREAARNKAKTGKGSMRQIRLHKGEVKPETGEFIDADNASDINRLHEQDFLGEIIPAAIARAKNEGRKAHILDTGCGLGFFTDQIRATFGDEVKVFGTTLTTGVSETKKKKIIQKMKEYAEEYPEKANPFLNQLNEKIHPNDKAVRSILEMQDFEEFDVIIDSFGELYYSTPGTYRPIVKPETLKLFNRTLEACVRKLLPGGKLFVGMMPPEAFYDILDKKFDLEDRLGVQIQINPTKDSFVITKNKKEAQARRVA